MATFTETGDQIWRNYVVDGVPASGKHNPDKADIRTWAGEVETEIAANETDIATNAANIATNTADIATNTTDIATNAADITALEAALNLQSLPGDIKMRAISTPPTGWLECDGSTISRTTYADLFAVIGTTFGAGDGSTTFAIPDLRGEFIRGWDNGRGVDSGRAFGSTQSDAFASHLHTVNPPSTQTTSDSHSHSSGSLATGSSSLAHDALWKPAGTASTNNLSSISSTTYVSTMSTSHSHSISGTTGSDSHTHWVDITQFNSGSTGDTETRPRNIALMFCIKY